MRCSQFVKHMVHNFQRSILRTAFNHFQNRQSYPSEITTAHMIKKKHGEKK